MKGLLITFIVLSIFIVLEAYKGEKRRDSNDVLYRWERSVRDGECRYKKSAWSDCDSSSMQRKSLNLKRGDSSCEQTKIITRKCKKACKYEKGDWSDCEISTNSRVRTDSLKPKSDPSCQPTRTLSKKCKKVCKYNKQASWSACDATTGNKTKVLILKSGNPQLCEANKKITKSCRRTNQGGNKSGKSSGHDDYDEE